MRSKPTILVSNDNVRCNRMAGFNHLYRCGKRKLSSCSHVDDILVSTIYSSIGLVYHQSCDSVYEKIYISLSQDDCFIY